MNLFHDFVALRDLFFHLATFLHENFHTVHNFIIIKNTAFTSTNLRKHLVLELTELDILFALNFQKRFSLLLKLRLHRFHNIAKTLAFEAIWRDCEVH